MKRSHELPTSNAVSTLRNERAGVVRAEQAEGVPSYVGLCDAGLYATGGGSTRSVATPWAV